MTLPGEILETEEVLAASRLTLEREQYVAALWQKPSMSEVEAAAALGLPASTWGLLKARNLTPPSFRLGRRLFYLTADLRAWLDEQKAKT